MTPHYADATTTVYAGDCLDVLRTLPDASVDAVVTDPPYGLGFMGKEWDSIKQEASRPPSADVIDAKFRNVFPRTGKGPAATSFDGHAFQAWCLEWTAECLRVLKPGGHLLAFGGTRTWHRLACAVEDAGFEMRDSIAWLYGSGFPKSLDVSKAIDKAAGAEREVVGRVPGRMPQAQAAGWGNPGVDEFRDARRGTVDMDVTAPATDAAREWQGWGTALKPAFEPIVVARKPLVGTVAQNVLMHGTGALNVDGCRVGDGKVQVAAGSTGNASIGPVGLNDGHRYEHGTGREYREGGRWPANVVLDESQAAALDQMSGETGANSVGRLTRTYDYEPSSQVPSDQPFDYGDTGGASRFFYTAKADASERVRVNGTAHPTVKPLALMRWLIRLVTPPGGTVLEPFAGSGTTVEACILEGFRCIAIERETDYLPLILQRIHRRRDPVQAVKGAGEDGGLFDLIGGELA